MKNRAPGGGNAPFLSPIIEPNAQPDTRIMADKPTELNGEALRQQLNQETGRLGWPELQRHFARGVVIALSAEMDLVEVASRFAQDDKARVEQWLGQGRIRRATDADALRWSRDEPVFWAVVVAPWVLVQEITLQ